MSDLKLASQDSQTVNIGWFTSADQSTFRSIATFDNSGNEIAKNTFYQLWLHAFNILTLEEENTMALEGDTIKIIDGTA